MNDFHYNMIKGRVAEAIVKELFQVNGYRVYDYGMERTLPEALENIKNQKSEMAYGIRHMPDFLVQHVESGQLQYVEVKYRANGQFSLANIENNPYKSCCFIVVSKENIQAISFNDLEQGIKLPGQSSYNLENASAFVLSTSSVEEYRGYAQMFFKGVK